MSDVVSQITVAIGLSVVAVVVTPVVAAAVAGAISAWAHGEIFERQRAWFEGLKDSTAEGRRADGGRFLGYLATCPFCLSYHVSLWLTVLAVCAGLLPWQSAVFVWLAAQLVGYRLYLYVAKDLP